MHEGTFCYTLGVRREDTTLYILFHYAKHSSLLSSAKPHSAAHLGLAVHTGMPFCHAILTSLRLEHNGVASAVALESHHPAPWVPHFEHFSPPCGRWYEQGFNCSMHGCSSI